MVELTESSCLCLLYEVKKILVLHNTLIYIYIRKYI